MRHRCQRRCDTSRRKIEETIAKVLMIGATVTVLGSLVLILGTIVWRGLPALNLDMLTQTPKGGYYLGKEGGILNAIVGSFYLAGGGTLLAVVISLPIALYLQIYAARTRRAELARLALDVLWGIPSIVYGAFGFIIMLAVGMRASLLGGIITLALLELPIIVRGMDEAIALVPNALREASLALGATRLETAIKVVAPADSAGPADGGAAGLWAGHRRRGIGAVHCRLHRPAARLAVQPGCLAAAGGVFPAWHTIPGSAGASVRLRRWCSL